MTDPISITTSALASFNHASNIIKALFELKVDTSVVAQLNQLNREIKSIYESNLSLQQNISALIAEKTELQKEIARFDTWEEKKKRYKLLSPWDSTVVYAVTKADSDGEPAHWICQQCYEKRKTSFLYPRRSKSGYEEFFCDCGAIVPSNHRGSHKIKYFEEYTNV